MNPQFRLSPSSPNQADSSYAYVDSSRVEDKMDDTWVNSEINFFILSNLNCKNILFSRLPYLAFLHQLPVTFYKSFLTMGR